MEEALSNIVTALSWLHSSLGLWTGNDREEDCSLQNWSVIVVCFNTWVPTQLSGTVTASSDGLSTPDCHLQSAGVSLLGTTSRPLTWLTGSPLSCSSWCARPGTPSTRRETGPSSTLTCRPPWRCSRGTPPTSPAGYSTLTTCELMLYSRTRQVLMWHYCKWSLWLV